MRRKVLIGPMMMIVMAAVVGGIVMAIMGPILEMSEVMGKQ